jgi:hypothetical protein
MKRVYRQLKSDWQSKNIDGNSTGLHSWWKVLYSQIELACVRMGINPSLGFIHLNKNSLVYDIADVLKPLLIEKALAAKPYDLAAFWVEYKALKVYKLIPIIIEYLLNKRRLTNKYLSGILMPK